MNHTFTTSTCGRAIRGTFCITTPLSCIEDPWDRERYRRAAWRASCPQWSLSVLSRPWGKVHEISINKGSACSALRCLCGPTAPSAGQKVSLHYRINRLFAVKAMHLILHSRINCVDAISRVYRHFEVFTHVVFLTMLHKKTGEERSHILQHNTVYYQWWCCNINIIIFK